MVFDTTDVKITGRGEVRLGPEELDLSIKGQLEEAAASRGCARRSRSTATCASPRSAIDAGDTAKQGAVAAALGAALTPVAALLAFIDPGLAKDENCAALLETAKAPATQTASKDEPAKRCAKR